MNTCMSSTSDEYFILLNYLFVNRTTKQCLQGLGLKHTNEQQVSIKVFNICKLFSDGFRNLLVSSIFGKWKTHVYHKYVLVVPCSSNLADDSRPEGPRFDPPHRKSFLL